MEAPSRGLQAYVHSIRQELVGVLIFVATIWGAFLLTHFVPGDWVDRLALIPRYWTRLPGIVFMPFLHKDLAHLFGNTIPLLVLLALLAGSRGRSSSIVAELIVLSGALLWTLGRNGSPEHPLSHIGASGLVFGLVTFHIAAGILERRPISILIAIIVGVLYGGMLSWELIFPFLSTNDRVSWEGHLFGAIAGIVVAFQWSAISRSSSSLSRPSI